VCPVPLPGSHTREDTEFAFKIFDAKLIVMSQFGKLPSLLTIGHG
jgi:hypothetical protein